MTRVWVKLDATYVEDEKIMAAGALAELVFIRSIAFCRRRVTDGDLSPGAVRGLMLGVPGDPTEIVAALVTHGLWDACDQGFSVRNYAEWQQTRTKLDSEAERKRTEREERKKERKKERDIARTFTGQTTDVPRTATDAPIITADYVRDNVHVLREQVTERAQP